MRRDADIVVVGGGIAGVATARALGGYPGSVLLLEQFAPGHTRGSSHGTSRIFRLNYSDERFVRMALAADAAWRELESARGERLIDRVGCLDLGPTANENVRAFAACGVRHEQLSAEETDARLRTNKLGLPQILLAVGFLVLIMYPAFAGLIDGLNP